MDKKRKIIQWISSILVNLNIKGIFTGELYKGKLKGLCVPGLNCYSCPAALGSCPLGSLQAVLSGAKMKITGYVLGMIMLFGTLFGRFICGWVCPFGLIQELLYKIPVPKLNRNLGKLKYIKYVVLAVFVVGIPLLYAFIKGMGYPAFCKYICPQGTIGGLLLAIKNESVRGLMKNAFLWKVIVLVLIVVASTVIFRPFCQIICPLGAIYGFFNSFAFIHLEVDKTACTNCNACQKACPVNVDAKTNCNSAECIRCGKCKDVCSKKAISVKCGWRKT